jgi:tRNA uridine 5-carbamoylmethylation protein Kti12
MAKAIILIGIQGSGKSTYAKELENNNDNIKRVTKDDIRFMLFDRKTYVEKFDENHKWFGNVVDSIYYDVVRTILNQSLDIIIDETNHIKSHRIGLIKWLKDHYPDIKVVAHYCHAELEDALRRNAMRPDHQNVPQPIVEEFHRELLEGFGGSWNIWSIVDNLWKEGFDDILVKSM